ncbi:hypothetical protein V6N12_022655 [Hibiscus sabdariffa]|uniref:Uncharacterized protein n=1 Tax=Hibiscus sabdariffa TaxID=183260 RepID=A0ABR2FVB4_9ROSI
MGNGTSTYFIKDSFLSGSKSVWLIDAQGNMRKVNLPAKAAEIMLEEPGYIASALEDALFLCELTMNFREGSLQSYGCDMGIIEAACRSRRKKISGAKVLPDLTATEEESGVEKGIHVPGYRLGNCRPWIPALEPIPQVL